MRAEETAEVAAAVSASLGIRLEAATRAFEERAAEAGGEERDAVVVDVAEERTEEKAEVAAAVSASLGIRLEAMTGLGREK